MRNTMRELSEIRQDINATDQAIRELYLRRMSLALEVATSKTQTNTKIYQPEREAEIIAECTAGIPEELQPKYTALLQNMIRASREYQYSHILLATPEKFPFHPLEEIPKPETVFYQGVPGAYQELAARELFPHCEPVHVLTWAEVFRSVRDGAAEIGVVPVENTTAGTVSEVYDLLLEYDLFINRSCIRKISHCLAAVPGAALSDVRRVCSHPHALPQCQAFISGHGLETIQVANTAIAAQTVAERQDKTLAAICSGEAAARYGLAVLAEGINDLQHNETRFIAVSRMLTCAPADNRLEIAFHIQNVPGSLDSVVSIFADYGIDMTEIHSRPLKDSPWSYVFYIDFVGNMRDHAIRALLYQLHEELPYLKVIGSYQVQASPCSVVTL